MHPYTRFCFILLTIGSLLLGGGCIETKSLSVTVAGRGSVSSTPEGIDCGQQCQHDFSLGSQVTLTATAEEGYELESWGGVCSGSEPTCQLELTEDRVVTATFKSNSDGDSDADTDAMNFCNEGLYTPTADNFASDYGTTYYVRPDGGDTDQCTGLVDAPYPGSGQEQPCAFSHPFILLPPDGTPIIQGSDTVIIGAGSYQMGIHAPGSDNCYEQGAFGCQMPQIPSGTTKERPTRILGQGWDSGCTNPPELFGVQRPEHLFDLRDSDNVYLDCLELTDHSSCVEHHCHSGICPSDTVDRCERDNYPFGEWASGGILAYNSSNVTLRNLNIHGLAAFGVHAGGLTDWKVENVRIAANGFVGWDGDVGHGESSNSGTTLFRCVSIEWNGCGETYPEGQPHGCWGQNAGGYGDGIGTEATGGDWIFENSNISHNTSDGLDLLYHTEGGTITIRQLRAEGNAGNQVKVAGNTNVVNSVLISNCDFFLGKSFTAHVNHCRAGAQTLALAFMPGDQMTLVNSTLYSNGRGIVLAEPRDSTVTPDCSESFVAYNNIFVGDLYSLEPSWGLASLYYQQYFDTQGGCPSLKMTGDYNIKFNFRRENTACEGTDTVNPLSANDQCVDPQIGPFTGQTIYINTIPPTGSPAIDMGMDVGGLIPATDFMGQGRPSGNGVDIGAFEVQ